MIKTGNMIQMKMREKQMAGFLQDADGKFIAGAFAAIEQQVRLVLAGIDCSEKRIVGKRLS